MREEARIVPTRDDGKIIWRVRLGYNPALAAMQPVKRLAVVQGERT